MMLLLKFIVLAIGCGFAIVYIFVMLTGSFVQLVVMMALLMAAIFVFSPKVGEWIER